MGIDRISGFDMVPYAVSRIPGVGAEKIEQQELRRQAEKQPEISVPSREESAAPVVPRKDAALEDISLTFNRQDSFEYIGRDSDIEKLDMQKAISDMQKDQILQQYHYFVGSAKDLMADSPDGIVIRKG